MKLLTKYRQLVQPYGWSEQFVDWAFITCVSAVLERRSHLNEHGLGFLYPNIYCIFVGPPATRKTTTAKLPIDLFLRGLDGGPLICSNMLTPAVLIDELQEAHKKKGHLSGSSPLFAFSGEFGVLIKDIGGGEIINLLLDFFDARRPGEAWCKNTKKWGRQELPNPALTLLACTTPKEIRESGLQATAGLGFTSRVIFVTEPYAVLGTTTFPRLDLKLIEEIRSEFARMSTFEGEFVSLAQTAAEFARIQNGANEWAINNNSSSLYASYMARKPVQIRKVSMLFSAMRSNERIIRPEDVLAAEVMINRAEGTLMRAFGAQIRYRDENLMQAIQDKIPRSGIISERNLLQAFIHDGQAVPVNHEFRDALEGLVRSGEIAIRVENGEALLVNAKLAKEVK